MTYSKPTVDLPNPVSLPTSFRSVEGKQLYNLTDYDKLKRFGYDGTVCEVGDYECMRKHPFFPGSSAVIGPVIPDTDIQHIMKENLENEDTTNTEVDSSFLIGFVAVAIFLLISYILVLIFAIGKTKNETVKIVIILGFLVPGIQPISFVLALLVLFGIIQ